MRLAIISAVAFSVVGCAAQPMDAERCLDQLTAQNPEVAPDEAAAVCDAAQTGKGDVGFCTDCKLRQERFEVLGQTCAVLHLDRDGDGCIDRRVPFRERRDYSVIVAADHDVCEARYHYLTGCDAPSDAPREFAVRLELSFGEGTWPTGEEPSECTTRRATDCVGALHIVIADGMPVATEDGQWRDDVRILARRAIGGVDLRQNRAVKTRIALGERWPMPPEEPLRVYTFLAEDGDRSLKRLPRAGDLTVNGVPGFTASARGLAAAAAMEGDLSMITGAGLRLKLYRWRPQPGDDHVWNWHMD